MSKPAKRTKPHIRAIKAAMPASLEPMLPTLTHRVFSSAEWIYEIKYDGWRATCLLHDGKAHLVSRKKNSLTERFPELREIGKLIKATTAVIDGEIVALDQDGLPRFEGLRSNRAKCSVVLYAFDLLYLDGYDLTTCPLVKRKALLKRILPKDNTGRVRYTDHISGSGERLFEKLEALNLEGMVMKRKSSVYSGLRSRDWLKVKTKSGKAEMRKRIENW
jgi:bifunctional non-homologous end joining protein LigD